MDPVGADFVHTVVEALKLAYADREVYYGDPDFADVPMETLLSDAYTAERRKLIGAAPPERCARARPRAARRGCRLRRRALRRAARHGGIAAGTGEPTVLAARLNRAAIPAIST